jgi:starch synthase
MAHLHGYRMRILVAASEVAPLAKTGGLADVAASLPVALRGRGHDCAVVMPLYRSVRSTAPSLKPTGLRFSVPLGNRLAWGSFWKTTIPESDVPVYAVENSSYFERDDPDKGAGYYQFLRGDGARVDYDDNCERFVFFNQAILELPRLTGFWPEVLHLNDWQTGLVPIYLKELYSKYADFTYQAKYRAIRTLLTIHNLAYQGLFWHLDLPLTGLPWRLFNHQNLEFFGKLSFLKAGIVHADLLNTVSQTYAKEIQTPYYGCGLQSVLMGRQKDLFGIVNGIDYNVWDPATDSDLATHYGAATVVEGKAACKAALQRQLGLAEEPGMVLLAMVSRLAEQKGVDLLCQIGPALLQKPAQLVVLGEGQVEYHRMLKEMQSRFPRQVGLTFGQHEPLAHKIEAGADIFLMPSIYEPCGLSQLYSLKYGAVPVVRATGGLCDTVVDATPERVAAGTGTGFVFAGMSAAAFLETVERAIGVYRNQPEQWLAIMRNGMRQDWSWQRSAQEYERLYERLVARRETV